jgi:10 TM Acyl Transferase domain found in Cas1p
MPPAQSLTLTSNNKKNSNSSSSSSNSLVQQHNNETQHEQQEQWTTIPIDDDSNRKYSKPTTTKSSISLLVSSFFNNNIIMNNNLLKHWKGASDFCKAQCQVVVVLIIAYIGNNWKYSYHRNENHNPRMFWCMNIALLVAGLATLKHEPSRQHRTIPGQSIIQLLSRPQTEEWKGWMQWAFIMVSEMQCGVQKGYIHDR